MKRVNFFYSLLYACLLFVFLSGNYKTIQAATTDAEDLNNALNTAPKGLNWKNNDFLLADFKKAAENRGEKIPTTNKINGHQYSLNNNAKIIQANNDPDTSVIQMTNDNWQTGAVWSNMGVDNYFDISKEQIASMWLYFGHTGVNVANPSTFPGDGMALVLHNDKNKENAIALSDGIPVNGQSLGTWGADWNPQNYSPDPIARTAIQNSWALEFDTFVNYSSNASKGEGVYFDGQLQTPLSMYKSRHIAAGYPGVANTYESYGAYPNYFSMQHIRPIYYPNMVDSTWHHVTIKWDPNAKTMTYTYNDKDPVTGVKKPVTQSNPVDNTKISDNDTTQVTIPIDTKYFNLGKDNTKLYWGFTGSTGTNSENNLMIFESVPSYVDATATSSILDVTQNKELKENDTVNINDNLKYKFDLHYIGWSKNWDQINTKFNIPKNVKFSSGSIYFPDTGKTYPITDFSNLDSVQFQLPESLTPDSRYAKIELDGTVTKPASKSDYKIPSEHASFEGDNLITSTETIPLSIKYNNFLLESDSKDIISVESKENATVLGKLSYLDNTPLINNDMTVHYTLNNKEYSFNLDDTNPATGFKINIDSSQLKSGYNPISFYVTDKSGNTTNTINKIIDVGGTLSFGVYSSSVSFKNVNNYHSNNTNNKIISRSGNWYVNVIDSRKKDSTWKVQASSSPLINDNKKALNGNLIYLNKNGEPYSLDSTPVNIATNIKTNDGPEETNITKDWTQNNGILLSLGPNNTSGIYSSLINWTLINSI